MGENWDGRLKERIEAELDAVKMTEETERRLLLGIHRQVKERGNIMKYPKRKKIIVIAAIIASIGTITAIAAGKIVGLSSGTSLNDAIHSAAELKSQADKKLEENLYIPEALSDGSAFMDGYVTEVKGQDKDGNTVMTYPEVIVNYGEGRAVCLSIHKTVSGLPEDPMNAQAEKDYNGIKMSAKEDQYLFLPPDAKPSEADLKLQEEGKLAISYGSETKEREVFKNVSWTKDGVEYLLFTYGDKSLDELIGMAKAYIDGK